MTSPDTPDTGAGTPLTAEEKIAGLDAWAASDAPDEEWAGVRKDTWRLARSRPATDPAVHVHDYGAARIPCSNPECRPATDPAGLDDGMDWRTLRYDADRRTLYVTFDGTPDVDVAEYVLPGFAKRLLARLSVADGPGPEERPGFCGSCGTLDHYAGDRTHPCLPVHREETTDG